MIQSRGMRLLVLFVSFVLIGCNSDRFAKLEKENEALQAQIKVQQANLDLESQAKCAKDSREFFRANWQSDADTLTLTYTNHFNKSRNKCVLLVENHYRADGGRTDSWQNIMSLYDVYENGDYGDLSVWHQISTDASEKLHLFECKVDGQKCTSVEEYVKLVRFWMNE